MLHEPDGPYELNGDELREDRTLADPSSDDDQGAISWWERLKGEFRGRRWVAPVAFFVLALGV